MRRPKRQGCVGGPGRAWSAIALVLSLLLGGQMMAAALGSANHGWVGWFSLLPLFLAIRLWPPAVALLGGALWGVVLYACSMGLPEASIAPTVRSLLLLAAIPAAYAWLGAWLTRRIGFNPYLLGVGWMGVEFALSPVGLASGLVAGGHAGGPILHWAGKALGYVLVGFLVALVNASLVSLVSGIRLRIPQGERRISLWDAGGSRCPEASLCLAVLAPLLLRARAPPVPRSGGRTSLRRGDSAQPREGRKVGRPPGYRAGGSGVSKRRQLGRTRRFKE